MNTHLYDAREWEVKAFLKNRKNLIILPIRRLKSRKKYSPYSLNDTIWIRETFIIESTFLSYSTL